MVRIEPGMFIMGTTDSQIARLNQLSIVSGSVERLKSEQPAHPVRITRPFYMGAYEVAVGQFRRFVDATGYRTEAETDGRGSRFWAKPEGREMVWRADLNWRHPGFSQEDDHPVVCVSWNDANAFCDWLNTFVRGPLRYRLPTEAEWEYACRAGTTTLFPNGDDPEKLSLIGNVCDASFLRRYPSWTPPSIQADDGSTYTARVGSYEANRWMLYDMIGNVFEWCQDGFYSDYYGKSPPEDPIASPKGSDRCIRGGSWDMLKFCRSTARVGNTPDDRVNNQGFRLAADIVK